MSNYPPGVTGDEYEIAGPDYEGDEPRDCPRCDGDMYEVGYRGERWWSCEDCGFTIDVPYPDEGPDPDRIRDERLDREADEVLYPDDDNYMHPQDE